LPELSRPFPRPSQTHVQELLHNFGGEGSYEAAN
jgi:hypothetical protein